MNLDRSVGNQKSSSVPGTEINQHTPLGIEMCMLVVGEHYTKPNMVLIQKYL